MTMSLPGEMVDEARREREAAALGPITSNIDRLIKDGMSGIGQIGAQMASGIARQPEAAGNIQTASIILAALIEGAALFGLGLAFLKF